MLRGIQEGQFPVRWSANLGYGYGMPLFEFYAPLPFFIGACLFWAVPDIVFVLKLIYLIANVLTFAGAYLLGKRLFGRLGGLVTAFAYTLAPYRAVNLYVRGAVSEAWGMMALPWILLGIVMVLQKKKAGFWVLLAGLITLMLSHNLTTMMFLPVSLVFVVCTGLAIYGFRSKKTTATPQTVTELKHISLITICSYACAIGFSAFYLFPTFLEKDYTQIGKIFTGYFTYSNHFLYIRQFFIPNWGYGGSAWGPNDGLSFFLGYGQLLGAIVFVVQAAWSGIKKQQLRRVWWGVAVAGILLFSCFMTLIKSQFLWDSIQLLQTIQFPWRWLSIASLFLALLGGTGVALLTNKRIRVAIAGLIIGVVLLGNFNYFRPERYLADADALYYTDPTRIREKMSPVLPDYIPKTMSEKLTPRRELFLVPGGTEKQVEVVIDRGHEKLFKTTFLSEVLFNPLIAQFPGWEAQIDGKPVVTTSGGQFGTLSFPVPAGEHLVSVRFGETPIRGWSDAVSAASIVLILGVAMYAYRDLRK